MAMYEALGPGDPEVNTPDVPIELPAREDVCLGNRAFLSAIVPSGLLFEFAQ